jgi:hypothetical protein
MKKQRKAKPRARKTRSRTGSKPAKAPSVLAQTVESPVPFLEVAVRERVTEASMMRVFEQVCAEVLTHNQRRVFVDMRESEIVLTISDKADMAKLIGKLFAGKIDRLACLLRPQDMPAEKFFEPSVSTRGVPTLTTTDLGDAIHWLTTSLLPAR